jgi:hypothetical protein
MIQLVAYKYLMYNCTNGIEFYCVIMTCSDEDYVEN